MKRLMKACGAGVLVLFSTWLGIVNHLEAYEVGIAWNFVSGELYLQDGSGFHLSPPWTLVARIDTRPQRVCITSSSRAAFNCKLVRFRPEAWKIFVETEGWRYYWLSNRISFNLSYDEEYRGFRDILRGYTFGSKAYPFVEVIREIEEDVS